MSLLDPKPVDLARERRRKKIIIYSIIALLWIAVLTWYFWNWPQERKVARFMDAVVAQDLERAYGIWQNDPEWKQHPQRYENYPFSRFELDWGPSGEWGKITKYDIKGSKSHGGGVIVVVNINDRAEDERLWVQKSDGTLTWSPY